MTRVDDFDEYDEYNLSRRILGTHPDGFYGAMGRVVCVCAVLEDKVTALRHALARVQQGRFSHQPINQQIKAARALLVDVPEPGREIMSSYLDRVDDAFGRRNDLVHSSFPAQASGQVFGHRMARDKAVTDGTAEVVSTTLADLKLFIGHLGDLVFEFNGVMAYTAIRPMSPPLGGRSPTGGTPAKQHTQCQTAPTGVRVMTSGRRLEHGPPARCVTVTSGK